jgi:hypothetical protein
MAVPHGGDGDAVEGVLWVWHSSIALLARSQAG